MRYSLKIEEAYHKELKYRTEKLEQENQEECVSNLKAKEVEWNSQLEQLKLGDLNSCKSDLETKIAAVEEL